jgi:hypothetical protein
VFAGVGKVLTFKLATIGDVRVYSDGIALLQENKQEPFIFRFSYGSSIAAAAIRSIADENLSLTAASKGHKQVSKCDRGTKSVQEQNALKSLYCGTFLYLSALR